MTDQERTALSRGDSPEYTSALLRYLGNRNPIQVFSETLLLLREVTGGLTRAQLRQPERPGKWSVLDVVCHLADVEVVLGYRYRVVLAQPGAPLPAIDQDAWVRRFESNQPLPEALEDFKAFRSANVRLLRRVPPERMQQFGQHEQRGRETLDRMIHLYAAHDLYHLGQIERIKASIAVPAES